MKRKMEVLEKTCRVCGETKEITEFPAKGRLCLICECDRVKDFYRLCGEYQQKKRYRNIKSRCSYFGATDVLAFDDFINIITSEDASCSYCGKTQIQHLEETGFSLALEHIQPLRKGGVHSRSNVTLACMRCNSLKSNKDLIEFFNEGHEFFTQERLNAVIQKMAQENNHDFETMKEMIYQRYQAYCLEPSKKELLAV